jgi:hypothetical protein
VIYEYRGQIYPSYLKEGNAAQFAIPAAQHFCKGKGLDVGCGKWPFPGSIPIEIKDGKEWGLRLYFQFTLPGTPE